MNWYKLLAHDIKCGLLRKRNLIPFLSFFILLSGCYTSFKSVDIEPTLSDYFVYVFLGTEPLSNGSRNDFVLPIIWFQTMLCPLYLNIDYLLGDLHKTGEQILVRCKYRRSWLLSKCVWNLCCSIMYFLALIIIAALITLKTERFSAVCTIELLTLLKIPVGFNEYEHSFRFAVLIIKPLLTISALNMLQMILCLYVKPTIAFINSLALLMISSFYEAPYLLGNGAMVIRSCSICEDCAFNIISEVFFTILIICFSILFGCVRIRNYNFINST